MADVLREFTLIVNTKGQIEAVKGFEKLDASMEKTSESSGELNRKFKAQAEATSNSTKAFAKNAQGLGGVVRIYATVAANVFALSSAYNLLKRNADLEILRRSSEQLSVTTGQNFSAIAESIKDVTGGAIEFRQAFQSANLALSGGLSGKQATQIAEIATKAANALGRSVPEAVTRLTQSIVKAEPELADEFGIILRVTEATNKYAKALGILPTELSTAQKQQAIFNQFLEQGTAKFANVEIQTNPYDKLAASFKEVTNRVTELIRVPLDGFVNLVADNGLLLVGIFGAIAAKLTSLAVPALREFTTELYKNSKAYSDKAAKEYVRAQEAVVAANLTAVESFEDYKGILGSAFKDTDLTKIKRKGFDASTLQADSVAEDLPRYLEQAAKGSDKVLNKFRDDIKTKLMGPDGKGLINGSIINVNGIKLTTSQAKIFMEGLEVATVEGAKRAKRAFEEEIGTVNRLGIELEQAKTKATAFSAQVKAATAGQFSAGLAGGFIENLKALPELFKKNIKGAKGFSSKFAGSMGLGSRALGTFIGGASKLLGVLGPLGLYGSIALSIFSEFADTLGITSQASRDVADGFIELEKDAKLLGKQIDHNKSLADGSLEGYIAQVKNASNLTVGFEEALTKVTKVLENLEKANREDLFSFGTASKIEKSLTTVIENIKKQAQTVPEGLRDEFIAAASALDVNLKSGAGIENIGTELTELAKRLEGLDFVEVLRKDGVAKDIKLNATITDENKKQLAATIKSIFKADQAEKLIQAINEGLLTGLRTANDLVKELDSNLSDAAATFKSFNDYADKQIRKFERSNPLIQQLDALKKQLEVVQNAAEKDGAPAILKEPDIQASGQALLGIDSDTARDVEATTLAVDVLRDAIVEYEVVTGTAKSKQKQFNAQIKEAQGLVSKGNLSAISDEYAARTNSVQTELNVTKQLILQKERDIDRAEQLKTVGEDQLQIFKEEKKALESQRDAQKSQLELYSETNAQRKIGLETAKELAKIESLKLTALNDQKSVLTAIATATGNAADKQAALDIEKQVTAQKVAQLSASIQIKRAELANGAQGATAGRLQQEIKLLQQKKGIQLELLAIRQVTGQRDINLAEIERVNKLEEQILNTKKAGLELEKGLADVRASDKFLTEAQNDAAKLLSLSKDLEITAENRAEAELKVATAAAKVEEETKALNKLDSKSVGFKETSERLQASQLELIQAENEARGLAVEQAEKLQKAEEERFEVAKKNASLFKDPQEFQELLGKQFQLAAKEFGEEMGSSINRIVDITLGTIDSGIDAFVDAVRNGEDALEAAKTAITDTFLELNADFIKDQFKLLARNAIATISGNKNFGKSEELVEAETQTSWLERIYNAIANPTPTTPGGGKQAQQQQQGMFDNITKFFKDTWTKVKDVFTNIGQSISTTVTDAFTGISDFIGGIDLSGMFDTVTSLFSSLSGSIGGGGAAGGGGGFGDLVSTGISLFFAKNGGIVNELSKRVPAYANGTITSGPELAMIGEGEKKEAVVPLPDNRSIPVTMEGSPEGSREVSNNFNISITGVQGNEEGIRRSANQLALQIAREQARAQGRIG